MRRAPTLTAQAVQDLSREERVHAIQVSCVCTFTSGSDRGLSTVGSSLGAELVICGLADGLDLTPAFQCRSSPLACRGDDPFLLMSNRQTLHFDHRVVLDLRFPTGLLYPCMLVYFVEKTTAEIVVT